jgi:catechol 2,3-dioxygenase-like lactoylglutathione lyase family enzyme
MMINGAHVIIYSKDAEADRSFFKDVLGFHSVDVGTRLANLCAASGRSRLPSW